MKLIISMMLFVLMACGQLPQDNTPTPFDNNFYTLEMDSCQSNMGLMACGYKSEELETKKLTIPVAHTGEIVITSQKCGFNYSQRFKDQTNVALSYKELTQNAPSEDSCVYDLKLFIDGFAKGFRGLFILYNTDGLTDLEGTVMGSPFKGALDFQFKKGHLAPSNNLVFVAPFSGKIYLDGCGYSEYEKNFNQKHEIQLGDLLTSEDMCVITAAIVSSSDSDPVYFGKIIVSQYTNVTPLTNPLVEMKRILGNDYLKITANALTAGIGIDDKNETFKGIRSSKELSKKTSKDQINTVRMMTNNGRYLLLKVKNGTIIWTPRIFF